MAAELFEDEIELDVETVEAVPPESREPNPCYPYPRLKPSGRSAVMRFRTVLLENPYLRVEVLPELGGRISSIFDKRTQRPIFEMRGRIPLQAEGPRGCWLTGGVHWAVGSGARRLNAMGPVEVQFAEPESESDSATVLLHELVLGQRLSWTAALSLPPDRAVLELSLRVLNRSLVAEPCRIGLQVEIGQQRWHRTMGGVGWWSDLMDAGLGVFASPGTWDSENPEGVFRGLEGELLMPRQTDSFTARLVPYSGMGEMQAFSPEGAITLREGRLRIQVTQPRMEHKAFLGTTDGQTLEAAASIYPERAFEADVASLGVEQVLLAGPNREEVLRWPAPAPDEEPAAQPETLPVPVRSGDFRQAVTRLLDGTGDLAAFTRCLRDPALRGPAHVALAMQRLTKAEIPAAISELEEALNHLADDHLTWWMKALAHRLDTPDPDEATDRPELPNAHFLAPMEPALRAEAFLSQPVTMGKEPNALVAPMANHPDALLEVAHLLLECGQIAEASRWIDECLRHREEPMLRVMQAWTFWKGSRMAVEAADALRRIAEMPIESPLPWRPLEVRAVRELSAAFPEDRRLRALEYAAVRAIR